MKLRPIFFNTLMLALCINAGSVANGKDTQEPLYLEKIKLPTGFKISVYARAPGARSMTLAPDGTLFVGTRTEGKVYAIRDKNNDQVADEVITLASNLNSPNGVAFRDGALFVAEISRITKYENILKNLKKPPTATLVSKDFPTDEHHGWKFIAFGPDGKLYVPVGAPCNICDPNESYAAIFRINADGKGKERVAYGIRNTVGFDWHPQTKELWFTDNGRDWLGDDLPPDELNRVAKTGQFFGYPFCHGNNIPDPEFTRKGACETHEKPVLELGAHVAALGMRFYKGTHFPKAYQNRIFIAQHGSWNRSKPVAYRVMSVAYEGSKATSYEVFAEGWLNPDGTPWGRPADVQVMPDGALLVSDDRAGAIYRIHYAGK